MPQNRFEKHPKITIVIFLAIFFMGLLFAMEKYLPAQDKSDAPLIQRYIRLMEWPPRTIVRSVPSDYLLKRTDSLVKKEYILRTDDNGFIIPSKIYESPDAVIVFLGGSTTACALVDENERFSYLTGRLLEKETGLKINSYNAGKLGANSLDDINILLNKVMPLKPDVAIMMEDVNDLTTLLYYKGYYNNRSSRSPIGLMAPVIKPSVGSLLTQIMDLTIPHVYQRAKSIINEIRYLEPPDDFKEIRTTKIIIDKPNIFKEFKINLRTFIALCKARNVIPVLMTQENRLKSNLDDVFEEGRLKFQKQGINYEELKDIYDRMNQAIRDVGAENGVAVIDLAAQIPQEQKYMYDLVHFNSFGSKAAADIISKELKPVILALKTKSNRIDST